MRLRKALWMVFWLVPAVFLQGCMAGGLATKNDVNYVKGDLEVRHAGLSEEVIALRNDDMEIDSQMSDLSYRLTDNKTRLARMQKEVSTAIGKIEKEVSAQEEDLRRLRKNDLARISDKMEGVQKEVRELRKHMDKQMKIILEEVTRENTRLSRRIDKLNRRPRSGGSGRHTVRRGESLSSIASLYGTSVGTLVESNNLDDPNSIYVGQELVVPEE